MAPKAKYRYDCEACSQSKKGQATKVATVHRGEGSYEVRVCSGCAASYQECFGDDVEMSPIG